MISIIVAIASDGGIGRDGQLLFRISDDLRRFRRLTTGHTVIMGRKTFESFPSGPLPDRRNIVVSRNPDYHAQGALTAASLPEAVGMAGDDDEIYIIGGGEIYRQALPLADRLDVTLIMATAAGGADTFFPEINPDEWRQAKMSELMTDPKSGVKYRFVTYLRNS